MTLNYEFSSLIGRAYNKGDVVFSNDNSLLYSPVSNRVSIFDLANNKLQTLPCACTYNVVAMTISPDNSMLLVVDEAGHAQFIGLHTRSSIHQHHFKRPVQSVAFSPDGRRFAVCLDNSVVLYRTPGHCPEVNPFVVDKRFPIMHHRATRLDWSSDSRVICAGSQDQNCYVIGCEIFLNLQSHSLCGLRDAVIGCFILKDSLDVIGLSELGELIVWSCDTALDGLKKGKRKDVAEMMIKGDDDDEDEDGDEVKKKKMVENVELPDCVRYKRSSKFSFRQLLNNDSSSSNNSSIIRMTSCDYHKQKQLLVTSFENGSFYLHEMPAFTPIHSLSISDQPIKTIRFDHSGDWVALGVPSLGQLLVWEWHSQCYILKQQGHHGLANCLDYSMDGRFIATGGEDSKVKVWDSSSGQCFITFNQHTSVVTGIKFNGNSKVVVSSSLDGTVRAFDMIRYRNFRVFTAPERTSTQFSCVAVDGEGEVVVAGGHDVFEVFVWSMKTGLLITVLSGHEGPVSSLSYSTSEHLLASASWDHTVRLWSIFQSNQTRQVVQLSSDALAVAFRPDGKQVAIATLDCHVTFYDVDTLQQQHCIEGAADLGYTRNKGDLVTAKKKSKSFRSITYTADGEHLLAGGDGGVVCLYHVTEEILFRKFYLSCNMSLDGTQEFLDRRRMTQWGNLDLVDGDDDVNADRKKLALPGVRQGDFSSRAFKPESRVSCVRFCPTGLSWSAATTEGVVTFTSEHQHSDSFDPYLLDTHITPPRILQAVEEGRFSDSVMMALRLNEAGLIERVLKAVCRGWDGGMKGDEERRVRNLGGNNKKKSTKKADNPSVVGDEDTEANSFVLLCSELADTYVTRLLRFVSGRLERGVHVEIYVRCCEALMVVGALRMRGKVGRERLELQSYLRGLQKALSKTSNILQVNERVCYNLKVLVDMSSKEGADSGIEGGAEESEMMVFSDDEN